MLCQDRHLLSWFRELRIPKKYPNFIEVKSTVIGVLKKKGLSCCQSTASSVDLQNAVNYMLIVTITALYQYKPQSLGFLLV